MVLLRKPTPEQLVMLMAESDDDASELLMFDIEPKYFLPSGGDAKQSLYAIFDACGKMPAIATHHEQLIMAVLAVAEQQLNAMAGRGSSPRVSPPAPNSPIRLVRAAWESRDGTCGDSAHRIAWLVIAAHPGPDR
jgi:hypothetical protein